MELIPVLSTLHAQKIMPEQEQTESIIVNMFLLVLLHHISNLLGTCFCAN